jgi:hypothetical protein
MSVLSDGILEAFLAWDASAIGLDPKRAGDVMIINPEGGWVASGEQFENRAFMLAKPGKYEIIAIAFEPSPVPFELRTALRAN